MNIQELANMAAEQVNANNDHIYLTLPVVTRDCWRNLSGEDSPLGWVVGAAADNPDREIVMFDCFDVLAWSIANGANISIEEIKIWR